MNKDDYLRLLADASVNNQSKFRPCSTEKPKSRGRPPKNYHPLLEKEKELNTVVKKILPKTTAVNICSKGSRLAHLFGLPKMHKKDRAMRPILSATDTYNYNLAKQLDDKLKPEAQCNTSRVYLLSQNPKGDFCLSAIVSNNQSE